MHRDIGFSELVEAGCGHSLDSSSHPGLETSHVLGLWKLWKHHLLETKEVTSLEMSPGRGDLSGKRPDGG